MKRLTSAMAAQLRAIPALNSVWKDLMMLAGNVTFSVRSDNSFLPFSGIMPDLESRYPSIRIRNIIPWVVNIPEKSISAFILSLFLKKVYHIAPGYTSAFGESSRKMEDTFQKRQFLS